MAQPEADFAVVNESLAPSRLHHIRSSAMPARDKRICVLVLGMHRSGTSALTRVISFLGAELPRNLMPPRPDDNELGFWEPRDLWTLHDRMLAEAGSRWDDWRRLDLSALPPARVTDYKEEIASQIVDEYGDARFIVLKEPRICRFVPLQVDLLRGQGYECHCVLALRHPLGVIGSLGRRNGMTAGFAALLWLRHMLDAEAATRSMPRALVSYDALLADWQSAVRRMTTHLGVEWPLGAAAADDEITNFLSTDLRHFAPDWQALRASDEIRAWLKNAYAALLRLEQEPNDLPALRVLDNVRKEFDAVSNAFGGALFAELAEREKNLESRLTEARSQSEEKEDVIQRLAGELAERQRVIDDLARECEERLRVSEERRILVQRLTDALHQRDAPVVNSGSSLPVTQGPGAPR